jgi:uncharacterized short protein YbdD (DUF466 family)
LEFRYRFRINKKLFIKIVVGMHEYDGYFRSKKKNAPDFLDSPLFKSAPLL